MKAIAYKELDLIDVVDEDNDTVYRHSCCTDEQYDSCELWTHMDCKSFLKEQGGARIYKTLSAAGY